MNLNHVTVHVTSYELQQMIREAIRKDFPNHTVDKISITADNGASVELKKTISSDWRDR